MFVENPKTYENTPLLAYFKIGIAAESHYMAKAKKTWVDGHRRKVPGKKNSVKVKGHYRKK